MAPLFLAAHFHFGNDSYCKLNITFSKIPSAKIHVVRLGQILWYPGDTLKDKIVDWWQFANFVSWNQIDFFVQLASVLGIFSFGRIFLFAL